MTYLTFHVRHNIKKDIVAYIKKEFDKKTQPHVTLHCRQELRIVRTSDIPLYWNRLLSRIEWRRSYEEGAEKIFVLETRASAQAS